MKKRENEILVESHLKPRDYTQDEVIRIVNELQYKKYIKHGAYPIDIYSSYDSEGRDIIVYIFLKKDTQELYQAWMNRELK